LAGGQSSRFGSNKAIQLLAGKPLVRHVVERVSEATEEVVVVVGRGEPTAEYYAVLPNGVRVVNDNLQGKSPLVGIATGLSAAESDYAAIVACDIPFVNDKVIELLFRRASNADAAIPRWNRQSIEPLQAVYRRVPTLKAASETLAPADLSLEDMIRKLGRVVYVSVEDEIARIDRGLSTFFNINTREDMKVAEKMLAEGVFSLKHSSGKGSWRGNLGP
jgi:molybdopterin-guanine dinucleotide biosynthesis protein A